MRTEITFTIEATKLLEAIRKSKVEGGDYHLTMAVKDLDVYGQQDSSEKVKITPDDYSKFDTLLTTYNINLKDIREIIKLAHSYWKALRADPRATDPIIFKYHEVHKSESKDRVYPEEFITNTLKIISGVRNISSDLYSRLKKTRPTDYPVFEDYYSHLYHDNSDYDDSEK